MSAATVLTSAMAGMPVLNGTEGSLAALIRYIAPILGWSIEFDNGPVIVIRPQSYKGGQALFYRIDDRAARGGAAPKVAEVRAYESMENINTGAGLVGPVYVNKSYYATTAAKRYYIIGDQYGFYLGTNTLRSSSDINAYSPHYFGFINRLVDDDIPLCSLCGQGDNGLMSNFFYCAGITTTSSAYILLHKNRSGVINVQSALIGGGGFQGENTGLGSLYNVSGTLIGVPSYPYLGQCLLSIPIINNGAAGTLTGFLPGLYAWHHSDYPAGLQNLATTDITLITPYEVDGKRLIAGWAWNNASNLKDSARPIWNVGEGFRP